MSQPLDLGDIQGLLKGGFGDLTEAAFLLATVTDRDAAKTWLAGARPTSVADMAASHLTTALQIAVSRGGLIALGLTESELAGFSAEFVGGMSGDPARSRRLGDVGANDPAHWAWGGARGEPDLLIMLYAAPGGMSALRRSVETADFAAGLSVIELETSDMKGREPFGFVDGVSQPTIDWGGARRPGTNADLEFGNLIAPGEFILGYANEYGHLTRRPMLEPASDPAGLLPPAPDEPARRDLGRNGAYLVFRQLSQDVRGFWRFVNAQAPAGAGQGLAEAMVGRKLEGEPLIAPGGTPIAGVPPAKPGAPRNDFTYLSDADGLVCPLGAHVRRANPRTADMPGGIGTWLTRQWRRLGFNKGDPGADVIAASRFHRILRRGREYGAPISPAAAADPATPDPKSGLNFVCLAANLARQFEFAQGAWLISAKFAGLSGEQDPLLGHRRPFPAPPVSAPKATDAFRLPRAGGLARTIAPVPRFVSVVGGAYFFLPGLKALRYLAGR